MQHESVANCSNVKKFQSLYNEVMEITSVFAINLKNFREGRKLSAKALGLIIGVTAKHVYDMEKGRRKPSARILDETAKAFGVSSSRMLSLEGGEPVIVEPVSRLKTMLFKKLESVPDEVYDLADGIPGDDKVWGDIKILLKGAKKRIKSPDLLDKT